MSQPTLILLSGLDGTAQLFDSFTAVAPPGVVFRALPLPSDGLQNYPQLAEWLAAQIASEPVVLVAESFSGPLAILTARQCSNVLAVVLCASFVEPPLPRWLGRLPRFMQTRPPSRSLLRLFLTGGDATLADAVIGAISGVDGRIIAERISAALSVDVTAALQDISQPVLYLRGTQDRLVGARSARRIRELKPSTQLIEMRAPHMLLQTNPTEAWRHIATFLASIARDDWAE